MTIAITKDSRYSPPHRAVRTTYCAVGSKAHLIDAGLCEAVQFPPGRRRTSFVWTSEDAYWSLKKGRGDVWTLCLADQPESKWILCELLMRGRIVPPAVLAVAWRPGAVEGPRRCTESKEARYPATGGK